ncbi:Uncharacterized protein BM_BM234 [Brugia malayi]|uniref:Bm234 n=1 Tax=Brugia malayi TaxID=6279 RepID=A0A0H5S254_BRUMA|nr:Uncharacterized protein BM_BM234 [Brugia malayi]CRZ22773.1 Bm234 [Brugia malayi]VIP00120.1 Uncharacterized protein BM_BM234 [Brugia malayi]
MIADGNEDSAEEYPSSFSALKIHPSLPIEQNFGNEISLTF